MLRNLRDIQQIYYLARTSHLIPSEQAYLKQLTSSSINSIRHVRLRQARPRLHGSCAHRPRDRNRHPLHRHLTGAPALRPGLRVPPVRARLPHPGRRRLRPRRRLRQSRPGRQGRTPRGAERPQDGQGRRPALQLHGQRRPDQPRRQDPAGRERCRHDAVRGRLWADPVRDGCRGAEGAGEQGLCAERAVYC